MSQPNQLLTPRRVTPVKPLLNQRHQKSLGWAVEKNNCTAAQWSKVPFSCERKLCVSF